jgi:uncharacterized protein YabE (DUF348 family)
MAQPAHLVVVPVRTAPKLGAFVPPPPEEIERDHPDRTRVHLAALPRGARWLVRLAVLALAVGAPALAFGGEHRVRVDVEGKIRTTRSYAIDASSLLARRGLETRANDLLVPNGRLSEGSSIKYRRAKHIRLVLDGKPQIVTARGVTVGEGLKDLGLVPGPRDHLYPAASTKLQPGLSVYVRNAIHAKLRVDGSLRDVVSSADTIGNLLAQAGVRVGPDDYVFPGRATEPHDGLWIRVVRVRHVVESRSIRIPFEYVTRRDPSMESGVRSVVQQGSEGLKVERFRILLEDGRRVATQLLSVKVVRPAQNYIVRVGTKEPTFKGGSGASQTGIASWFNADGLVAAHRSLPIGTVVRVTNLANGRAVNVRINQRGPFVEGRIIDLSDDAYGRLAPIGSGTIKVKVQS